MSFEVPEDYQQLLDVLDRDRLPVVVFFEPGMMYATDYRVAEDSPVRTGDETVRGELIAQVVAFTGQEAEREWHASQ